MKKTIRLIVFLFLAGTQFCFAQRREVSGRVTDASDGSPVAGATVIIKGTDMGTATDANGRYTLKNVQPHAILFSSGANTADLAPITILTSPRFMRIHSSYLSPYASLL